MCLDNCYTIKLKKFVFLVGERGESNGLGVCMVRRTSNANTREIRKHANKNSSYKQNLTEGNFACSRKRKRATQKGYRWSAVQIEAILEHLKELSLGHFVGKSVCFWLVWSGCMENCWLQQSYRPNKVCHGLAYCTWNGKLDRPAAVALTNSSWRRTVLFAVQVGRFFVALKLLSLCML